MHADRRQVRAALGMLLVIGIIINAAALVLFSRSLSGIRSTFCTYEQGIYAATLTLPQVPGRLDAERSDLKLMRQLGCKGS